MSASHLQRPWPILRGGLGHWIRPRPRLVVKKFAEILDVEESNVRMGSDSSLERFQVQPKWEIPG